MDVSKTVRASVRDLNEGLEFSGSNISPDFDLSPDTINMSMGLYRGIGPRYGMSAVKNQTHGEVNPQNLSAAYAANNLQVSEGVAGLYQGRNRLWGVFPIKIDTLTTPVYVWATGTNSSVDFSYGTVPSGTATDFVQSPAGGIHQGLAGEASSPYIQGRISNLRVRSGSNFRFPNSTLPYNTRCTFLNVSGRNVPFFTFLGKKTATQSAPTNLSPGTFSIDSFGWTREMNAGLSSANAYVEFTALGATANGGNQRFMYKYTYSGLSLSISAIRARDAYGDNVFVSMNATTVTAGGSAGSLTWNHHILTKTNFTYCNSSYNAFFAANGNQPVGAIFQEWMNGRSYDFLGGAFIQNASMQYFDPCDLSFEPRQSNTLHQDGIAQYTENTVVKGTAWDYWPNFVGGTALQDDTAARDGKIHVVLGAADSGLLRKNTIYEIAYSVYDKSTDTESNVGAPARVQTGANDFVRLSIYRQQTVTFTDLAPQNQLLPLRQPSNVLLNFLELRVYYREVGTFDWLPTARIDFASFFFDPTVKTIWVCENPIASLPGCQPGGINDSSSLPRDKYMDVISYQGCVFWMSSKNVVYSNKNNVFTYPVLNSVSTQNGFFLGMIERAAPGENQTTSDLVVFTSTGAYLGRFAGEGYFLPITVRTSPDTVGEFDRPGSDFRMSFWTADTAFSGRAACVAEGILYYWGPNGIYRDEGGGRPTKEFSRHLEPWLGTIFDPARTTEITSVYSSRTKEIIWFFPPSSSLGAVGTRALVFNTASGAFYWFNFPTVVVDWAQVVDVGTDAAHNQDGNGRRILLGVRSSISGATATPQRVVHFDDLCGTGDYPVPYQIQIKQIQAISGGYLLTVASGSTIPASLTGTKLTINKFKYYANRTEECDGIYTITAQTASTITIATLAGVTALPTSTLQQPHFIPVHLESVCGFSLGLRSNYFEPFGMEFWGQWLYVHARFKVSLPVGASGSLTYQFYSLIGSTYSVNTATLTDNCRGNAQIRTQIPFSMQNAEGQALSIAIAPTSGKWNGGTWYLQALSFDIAPMPKGHLAHWESN